MVLVVAAVGLGAVIDQAGALPAGLGMCMLVLLPSNGQEVAAPPSGRGHLLGEGERAHQVGAGVLQLLPRSAGVRLVSGHGGYGRGLSCSGRLIVIANANATRVTH
ncbi:hypothetical protein GCM10010124_31710 [Pilimelia terevasa]|uniref:Uncharacterized protein n=1 Tax=Pilimelia terevasa TaxID=53372 RepID=A0A8J3BPD8_9ACTN|nr:hypothetical protein GCM10010124_31710 [Pilimelia terevasa]